MKHYSEAELLELFYLPPADYLPMRVHMAECEECTRRYHRLQQKLQPPACERHDDKPGTFWDRQRFSIMRKIQMRESATRARTFPVRPVAAAAIVVALLLSGVLISRSATEQTSAPEQAALAAEGGEPATEPAAEIFHELRAVNDPWSSEELEPFRDVVEWESWAVEQEPVMRGES